MKSTLLILLLIACSFAQSPLRIALPERAIPIGKTWDLNAVAEVSFEERTNRRGLWFGDRLLASLGQKQDSQEEILEALEDDGWLLLRLAWGSKEVANIQDREWRYSRLILVRQQGAGIQSVFQIHRQDDMAVKGQQGSVEKFKSLSRRDESAVVQLNILHDGRQVAEAREIKLLTGKILPNRPDSKEELPPLKLPVAVTDLAPLQLPDTDLRDVANIYLHFIRGDAIDSEPLTGKVTIESEPATEEKRIEILEEAFTKAGFGIVELKPNAIRFVRLSQPPGAAELPVILNIGDLPKRERLITYIYKTRARSPEQLVQTLRQKPGLAIARLSLMQADTASRSIVFAGASSSIREILKQLETLDVQLKVIPK